MAALGAATVLLLPVLIGMGAKWSAAAELRQLQSSNGALRVEFMVETTQSIFDAAGRSVLPRLHRAAAGRLTGAHFGTYDYTANCDITAAQKRYLAAIKGLAEVRKLALPALQVNIARKQVNVAAGTVTTAS